MLLGPINVEWPVFRQIREKEPSSPAIDLRRLDGSLYEAELRGLDRAPGRKPKQLALSPQAGVFLFVGEDLPGQVVYRHWTFEIGHDGIRAVLLPHECSP